MEQRTGRRYPRYGRKKERDPYLFVLLIQIAVCALLTAGGAWTARFQPRTAESLRGCYGGLLMREGRTLPSAGALAALPARYLEARDAAIDAVGRMVADLISPQGTPEPGEPLEVGGEAGEPRAADAGTDAAASAAAPAGEIPISAGEPGMEALDGMGGWLGAPKSDPREVPASCSLAPVFSPVALAPPASGKVTSFYGYRVHPITDSDDFHRGVDIAAPEGSGIYLPLPGRVAEIDSSAIYGNYVTVDHGNGLLTTYSHCSEVAAPLGANLRRGELVALVGSTGMSTGPHCHFELRKDGVYYNPAWVLDGMAGHGV